MCLVRLFFLLFIVVLFANGDDFFGSKELVEKFFNSHSTRAAAATGCPPKLQKIPLNKMAFDSSAADALMSKSFNFGGVIYGIWDATSKVRFRF